MQARAATRVEAVKIGRAMVLEELIHHCVDDHDFKVDVQTTNHKPQTTNHKPQTSNLKPQTPNPKPQTSNPKPQTTDPNPQPCTPFQDGNLFFRFMSFEQPSYFSSRSTCLSYLSSEHRREGLLL